MNLHAGWSATGRLQSEVGATRNIRPFTSADCKEATIVLVFASEFTIVRSAE
jgi:hypothetical protein